MKNLTAKLLFALLPFASLQAEIIKFDDEDIRLLRAADPIVLLTFPPSYAFTQGAQLAQENGYRYFSFVSYECSIGDYKTAAHFTPPSLSGTFLTYDDEWIHVEIMGYIDEPSELDVFDTDHYKIILNSSEFEDEDEEED